MKTAGVTMVKDEADVIEGCLRHMADEVDMLVIADNMSTDDTRKIIDSLDLPVPFVVIDDDDPGYYQSEKMSRLAAMAAEMGATWIVPFDADEIWVGEHRVADVLKNDCEGENVAPAKLYNHFATAIDPDGPDPFSRMEWRQREPGALPKVAFRWEPGATIHQGNHGVNLPNGSTVGRQRIQVRHFPYRSPEQMVRKARNGAAAYAATDLHESMGAHWRSYGALIDRFGEEAMHDVFREHFWYFSPIDNGMVHDPAPYRRWRRS